MIPLNLLKCKTQIIYFSILLLMCICLFFPSCFPADPISVSDADVVTTFKKSSADFSSKKTYAMPDSVIYVSGDETEASKYPLLDQEILTAIKRNMLQYGYSQEEDPADADLLVTVWTTTTKWVTGGCYPWYWSYWYPYWGYCYPVSYTYETGTIFIVLVDPQIGNGSSEDAEWVAAINGLLEASGDANARIDRNIDQAFEQSSYLADGK